MRRWRTGTKVGRTVYIGDELVGVMDTPALAAHVVRLANADIDAAESPSEAVDVRGHLAWVDDVSRRYLEKHDMEILGIAPRPAPVDPAACRVCGESAPGRVGVCDRDDYAHCRACCEELGDGSSWEPR